MDSNGEVQANDAEPDGRPAGTSGADPTGRETDPGDGEPVVEPGAGAGEPAEDSGAAEGLFDVGYDPNGAAEYECVACGLIVSATEHPMNCPECDAAMCNRATPNE